jgi:hypothetical protein
MNGTRLAMTWLVALAALAALAAPPGCQRGFYRAQADADAYSLIYGKTQYPHWPLEGYTIEVDPRSRMYTDDDPDRPPMPPDDPVAHRMMHCVACKKGYPHWHADGDTPFVQNPAWLHYLPLNDEGILVLSAEDAVRTARLHSRDYQGELEDLYLSALDVSFERFRFDAQFFAGESVRFTADGPDRPGAPSTGSVSVLDVSTFPSPRGVRMEKLYATGGELVVGLANSLVWQFSGPDEHSARTIIDFSLVQPLLRNAGRDKVLERLTVSERSLLYNVRAMERFNREFYVEIMTGRSAGGGPQRRGGLFGGSGLEGFSGVGGGGFGRVGESGSISAGGTAGGAGAGQAGGYLGLLQAQQDIRNQKANIAALRDSVTLLDAFQEAGRIDSLQVQLTRQAQYNAESRLLTSQVAYESALDRFKSTLGLPPQLSVLISDPMLDRFNLIDPENTAAREQLTRLQKQVGELIVALLPEIERPADAAAAGDARKKECYPCLDMDPAKNTAAAGEVQPQPMPAPLPPHVVGPPIVWSERLAGQLRALLAKLGELDRDQARYLAANIVMARGDIARLRQMLDRRGAGLLQLRERIRNEGIDGTPVDVDERVFDVRRLRNRPDELQRDLGRLEECLAELPAALKNCTGHIRNILEEGPALPPAELSGRLSRHVFSLPELIAVVNNQVLEIALIQARARTESIELVEIDIRPEEALEIARKYRRDWMNARGALVDSWRLIAFNADELQSDLDILFSGDIQNTGDNPLRLRGDTGRLRVGVQFDSPLTRLAQRNNYRQSLLEYHEARRNYYSFEDAVARSLRDTLRAVRLNQLNFELRRAAVHVAVEQVDRAGKNLRVPLQPGEDATQKQLGPTVARDLVSALSDLLNVQNDFLSVWVNYEVQRRVLDLDMGTMQVDHDTVWLDPGPVSRAFVESLLGDELCDPEGVPPRGDRDGDEVPPMEDFGVELVPPGLHELPRP